MRMKQLLISTAMLLFFSLTFLAPGMAFLIEEGEKNGIAYMSGGVGINERALMQKKEGRPFNLKLVFAEISGRYLANPEVVIHDANGKKVFQIESSGPWLYVDLPPGQYKCTAVHADQTKIRKIAVGNFLKEILIHWKR